MVFQKLLFLIETVCLLVPQHLFRSYGTILKFSSSYHSQTNGQTENLNKTLEMYLRCYVFDKI